MSATTETLLNQLMAECGDTSAVRRVCRLVVALESERDALRERCEKLEWLVEVQEFYMYRLRNPGGWSTPGMEREKIGVAWQRRSAANDELRAMYLDALAATEVKNG